MRRLLVVFALFLGVVWAGFPVDACTGIRLTSGDGAVLYGRTMEWGTFDLNTRITVIPRGSAFTALTPDGKGGKTWKTRYGVVGLDMCGKPTLADGLNEKGLAVGMFYHPGFADYAAFKGSERSRTLSPLDVAGYILTNFADVEEARAGLSRVRVVDVLEPTIGAGVPGHWMVTDRSGRSIVVECTGGEVKVHDAPLGVITNAPNYDWHMTNLRNYVNLSPFALPGKKIGELDFTPLGAGSGMIGLPGDNTPPSRFIRAVAWTQTARKTATAGEAVYEVFRIMDDFNLPLGPGAAEGHAGAQAPAGLMRSSTIWTAAWDLANLKLYYHTQHNRRVRLFDIKAVDLTSGGVRHYPLDKVKAQDYEDVTPR
ncbi:MAG TPA: choloylglycine hydrolase family protein [Desulfovibrio sp.]|jgi:choloylglycine hydrolase|uniref:choloylglycine hydrolase family protein n=2 Tax=Desulfovibrionaceae TaxID=194924 RepID=UPI002D119FF6|nr:choloylglycine hydrolase family protein [Desulfovibrio sp.]HMM37584.1 choloylglycine hydrolase family protein [Desulfovibrio sp.]